MLCDICKKNEATIHIKEMHDNKWTSINLCAECAKKNNLDASPDTPGVDITQMLIGLGKALEAQGKKNIPTHQHSAKPENLPVMSNCPICDWSVADINKNHGKLGCPACYCHFGELLENSIAKIQKGTSHVGKNPLNAPQNEYARFQYTLAILEQTLAKHVAGEQYTEAAKVRDAIAGLKESFAASQREKEESFRQAVIEGRKHARRIEEEDI